MKRFSRVIYLGRAEGAASACGGPSFRVTLTRRFEGRAPRPFSVSTSRSLYARFAFRRRAKSATTPARARQPTAIPTIMGAALLLPPQSQKPHFFCLDFTEAEYLPIVEHQ